jgi:hypothetical protein
MSSVMLRSHEILEIQQHLTAIYKILGNTPSAAESPIKKVKSSGKAADTAWLASYKRASDLIRHVYNRYKLSQESIAKLIGNDPRWQSHRIQEDKRVLAASGIKQIRTYSMSQTGNPYYRKERCDEIIEILTDMFGVPEVSDE